MSRPRLLALAAWLATFATVIVLAVAALSVARLDVLFSALLGVGALVLAWLSAGAVLVAIRQRAEGAACAPTGCGACGQSCLR